MVIAMSASALPSKLTLPAASPLTESVRDVSSAEAVSALPVSAPSMSATREALFPAESVGIVADGSEAKSLKR